MISLVFYILTAIRCQNPDEAVRDYIRFSMKNAPKPLLIPHMTRVDDNHIVMGKVPNLYVARTDKIRSIGWDSNIRMLDHQDFFWKSSGNLVTAIALGTAVFHYHNPFDRYYQQFRQDVSNDRKYIIRKNYK